MLRFHGMTRTCIAVADASRARLFVLERTTNASGSHEELAEKTDLVNPQRRLRESELFTDSYVFEDHREDHIERMDAEFAHAIVGELHRLVRAAPTAQVIVCASPNMLGELRAIGIDSPDGATLDEIPRDLVKLTPTQLRDQLADYGVLPVPPPRAGLVM